MRRQARTRDWLAGLASGDEGMGAAANDTPGPVLVNGSRWTGVIGRGVH